MPAYGVQAATTLDALLTALEARSIKVQILLWAGSNVPTATAEQVTNTQMRTWVQTNMPNHGEVYLQPFANEWITRSSNHQKLVVVNSAGALTALVGGFNLGSNYYSDTNHGQPANNTWRTGNRWDSNLWHDVAVALQGPAAGAVEQIWVTNWNKPGNTFANAVAAGAQAAQPAALPVTIATTQRGTRPWMYFWTAETYETDIRDMLIDRINAAATYIYLENYALTAPGVIAALSRRITAGVRVIVNIHHPQSRMFFADQVWSFLMYFTMVALSAPQAVSISVKRFVPIIGIGTPFSTTYNGADYRFALVPGPNINNPMVAIQDFYDTKISYQHRRDAQDNGSFRIRDITDMNAGPAVMYAPRRSWDYTVAHGGVRTEYPYVHSKVAIIDDRYAFVGSSNWTHRSMVNDGEISAVIDDAAGVDAFRQRLWQHWGVNVGPGAANAATWPAAPAAPANGQVRMQALGYGDFMRPYSAAAYLTGSTWLGWYAPNYF